MTDLLKQLTLEEKAALLFHGKNSQAGLVDAKDAFPMKSARSNDLSVYKCHLANKPDEVRNSGTGRAHHRHSYQDLWHSYIEQRLLTLVWYLREKWVLFCRRTESVEARRHFCPKGDKPCLAEYYRDFVC
jgi:hypothetical protein